MLYLQLTRFNNYAIVKTSKTRQFNKGGVVA